MWDLPGTLASSGMQSLRFSVIQNPCRQTTPAPPTLGLGCLVQILPLLFVMAITWQFSG